MISKLRAVDISALQLAQVQFVDSGGTNGWLAKPGWLDEFVAGLELGKVHRSLCRMLPPYQGIPPHVDQGDFTRYQLPLVTDPAITMRYENTEQHLERGWLYRVNHRALHEVIHRAPIERIHIHIDVL